MNERKIIRAYNTNQKRGMINASTSERVTAAVVSLLLIAGCLFLLTRCKSIPTPDAKIKAEQIDATVLRVEAELPSSPLRDAIVRQLTTDKEDFITVSNTAQTLATRAQKAESEAKNNAGYKHLVLGGLALLGLTGLGLGLAKIKGWL